jgi:predicted esterase
VLVLYKRTTTVVSSVDMERTESSPEAAAFCGLEHLIKLQPDPTAPLILLVHGKAGDRKVMWTFERTLPPHASVVSVQAFLPDPLGGFSWWPGNAAPDTTQHAVSLVGSFIEKFLDFYRRTPSKIFGVGFSQGAAVLSSYALSNVEPRLAGVALLAGFIPEFAEWENAAELPDLFVAHGTEDDVISFEHAERCTSRLRESGVAVTFVSESVRHKIGVEGFRALKSWLAERIA